jgi:hypothetical protein
VIAVHNLDVDTGFRHSSGDFTELTWPPLVESLNQDIPHCQYTNVRGFESLAGCFAICKKKVGDAISIYDPGASALDTHSGSAQRLTHFGQSAGTVLQLNG